MSLASTLPYFCTIQVRSFVQSIDVGFNFLNHSLALPLKFNLAILNNLSSFKIPDFCRHCQSFSLIIYILMISSLEQLIHALRISYFDPSCLKIYLLPIFCYRICYTPIFLQVVVSSTIITYITFCFYDLDEAPLPFIRFCPNYCLSAES